MVARPFHFALLFWGEHYRNHYFLDKFLPSMMAPGNLPLLDAKDGHKLIIACPKDDWLEIQTSLVASPIRQHVNLEWIEIDHPITKVDDNLRTKAIVHQHKWMSVLLRKTHDPNAIGSIYSPDVIVSMRLVERMLSWVDYYDVAILPVLRQAEEPLLDEIKNRRIFTPREMTDLCIRHLHREMHPFIEPVHEKLTHAPYRLWRMPGDGLLLHGFFGLPIFMDYRFISPDYREGNIDTCLRTGNFSQCERVHIVADSDEVSMISLTPKDQKNFFDFGRANPGLYSYLGNIRTAWKFFGEDRVRRQMWRTPIRWHPYQLTPEWLEAEAAIERGLALAISENPINWLAFDLPRKVSPYIPRRVFG